MNLEHFNSAPMHISTDNGEITFATGELIGCLSSYDGVGISITDAVIYAKLILTAIDIVRVRGRFVISVSCWRKTHRLQTSVYLRKVCTGYVQLMWYTADGKTRAEIHEFMGELW